MDLDVKHPGRGWISERSAERLRPGVTYGVGGWTDDESWSLSQVQFSLSRLKTLQPGQVLVEIQDDNDDSVRDAALSRQDFVKYACD